MTDTGSRPLTSFPKEVTRLMAVSTNDLRNGMTLNLPEGLFNVIEFQHVKPGKGGAFVRTKLKNQRTGAVIERTYRADEKLEQAIIDKREMQFLYRDGGDYVFMDTRAYDQLQVETGLLGDAANYLKEGDDAVLRVLRRRDRGRRTARPPSSSPSPRPSPACRATGCRAPASRPPSRPAWSSRCRSSSTRARRSGRHPHGRVPDPGLSPHAGPAPAAAPDPRHTMHPPR